MLHNTHTTTTVQQEGTVLRKLAHMKRSLLYCVKFQGSFFYLDLHTFLLGRKKFNSLVLQLCSKILAV